jgi:alpha-tubulin suppressor-like RCC1 family protein
MNSEQSGRGDLKLFLILHHLPLVVFLFATAVARCDAAGLVAAWSDNSYGQCQLPGGLNNIKAIAAGSDHNLVLKSDGTVVAWGNNYAGASTVPENLSNVIGLAAGGAHSLALKVDGTVVAWGDNEFGRADVPSDLAHVIAVAAGFGHSMALKADGTVVAWGWNPYGQTDVPAGLANVRAISVASLGSYCMALKADGTVASWGWLHNVPPDLTNVMAIAAGAAHSLALRADGSVVAWGDNSHGQATVPAELSNVVAIAAGSYHSLALKNNGAMVAWGDNTYGQLNLPYGISNVTAIAAGDAHSLALVSEGPIQIIQEPPSQAMAYTSNAIVSVLATGAEPLSYQWFFNGQALTDGERVSGATNATLAFTNLRFGDAGTYQVIISNTFGSVVSADAILAVIGSPMVVEQSDNQTVRAGSDVTLWVSADGTPPLSFQWMFNGTNVPGATNSTLLLVNALPEATGLYSLAISNDYGGIQSADILLTVNNSSPFIIRQPVGQIAPLGGIATLSVSARGSVPLSYQWRFNGADIPGATNAALVLGNLSCGQTGFYSVAISNAFGTILSAKALLSVVQVFVWGDYYGGLAPTNIPLGLTNAIAVAAGDRHVVALKADGTVAIWAKDSFPASWTNVPAGLSEVIAVAAGGGTGLALRSDGRVIAWGDNANGKTNVPSGLSNVVAIAASRTCCLALKSDGLVSAWGLSSQTNVPVSASNVVGVAAGEYSCLALKSDGKVVAWGQNFAFPPPGLSNVIAVGAGSGNSSMALKRDGTVVGWGNQYGPIP